jgi:DNA-binding beta-propeller fold protein YncE
MKWAVLLAILPLATAQELVVVEKKAHALGFYSLDGARVAGVPLRTHPHELIYSPDNRFAYVTENGLLWMTDPGKGGNSIAIVDLKEKKLAGRIELGDNYRPHGMDINPRNWQMVVTVEGPAGLLLIDLKERKVLRRYDTKGDAPHMVTLDKKGEIAWVSNSHSGTLAAVNLATGDVKLIEGGKNTQQSVISADGKFLYLTVSEANVILEIDLSTHKVLRRIETGTFPARLAFYNNGKGLIYNTIKGVAWADLTTGKEIAKAELPGRPLSMTLSKDGKRAYLGVQDEDQIAIVDVAQKKVIRYLKTPAGTGPDPILDLP